MSEIIYDCRWSDEVDEKFIQEIGEDTYLMRGLTELSEVEDGLGITFSDDFETLNGFLVSKLEHIPSVNEKASIKYRNYMFEIAGIVDNTIDLVKVSIVKNNGLQDS